MASPTTKTPPTFADGVQAAMQDLASAMSAPDADLHFGTEMIKVMGIYLKHKNAGTPQAQGQQPSPGAPGGTPQGQPQGAPPASGPGGNAGPPAGGAGGPAPGMTTPGGPAGGSAQNPQMPSVQPPAGPSEPGSGPTPGLTPNPDELRRVLQEVAGQ